MSSPLEDSQMPAAIPADAAEMPADAAGIQTAEQLADLLEEGKELDAMSHELVRTAAVIGICFIALIVLWIKVL